MSNEHLNLDELQCSDEYANFVMNNCQAGYGDRIICDGDSLTMAMEDGFLFGEFLVEFFKKDKDKIDVR